MLTKNIVYQYSQQAISSFINARFTGEAESTDLAVNTDEVEMAAWFTREN